MVTVEKSIATASSIYEELINNYNITFKDIFLINTKENDTYKVYSDNNKFIFKVYRLFSLNKLHAINNIVSRYYKISYIINTKNNNLYVKLIYPEGYKIGILYQYFEGNYIYNNTKLIKLCGLSLSAFHLFNINKYTETSIESNTIDFSCAFSKCCLDNNTKRYIMNMSNYISNFNTSILQKYEISYCHGDCHFNNFIFNNDKIYLIDFDYLHINYILYDITYVIWTCFYNFKQSTFEICNFLQGYYEYKPFKKLIFEIIEYFFINIELYYLYYCLYRQIEIGTNNINDNFIIRRIDLSYDLKSYIYKINSIMLHTNK